MLTSDEKTKLAEIYEPILFQHPEERYDPVSPAMYMTGSGMWCNKPISSNRSTWGDCEQTPSFDFPREALIPRGQLSVNLADLDNPNVSFIGRSEESFRTFQVSNEERELFIARLSWSEGGPEVSGSISNSSENFLEVAPFQTNQPTYYVDVRDQDSIAAIPRDEGTPLPPGFDMALRSLYPNGYWLITYHFFYAYHVERLTDCEIDSEVIRAKRADEFFANNLHGSYEGDWHAITVLVPNPGVPPPAGAPTGTPPMPISPLNLTDDAFPMPEYVGFSRRARGVLVNIGANVVDSRNYTFMALKSVVGGETRFSGTHVKAFVARGTHNMYSLPGNNTAPKFDDELPFPIELVNTCILADNFEYVFAKVEEIREKIGGAIDKGRKAGISIAKILAGAAAGGLLGAAGGPIGGIVGALFGAWGGAIAAAIEGLLDPGPDSIPGQPEPAPGPKNVGDVGPILDPDSEEPSFGTVVVPTTLLEALSTELGDEATVIRSWGENFASRVIDRTDGIQPWWQPDGDHPQGYQGLWGARVSRDPFNRRSGTRIPSFEAIFINALLKDLG